MKRTRLPERVIIGGGFLAAAFTQCYSLFGIQSASPNWVRPEDSQSSYGVFDGHAAEQCTSPVIDEDT